MKKLTVKSALEIFNTKSAMVRAISNARLHGKDAFGNEMTAETIEAHKEEIAKLEKQIDEMPKVCISCMVGYRSFYFEVVQIGKTMIHDGEKVTKGNGYRCVEIIPEITDKMRNDMIEDSYCY